MRFDVHAVIALLLKAFNEFQWVLYIIVYHDNIYVIHLRKIEKIIHPNIPRATHTPFMCSVQFWCYKNTWLKNIRFGHV